MHLDDERSQRLLHQELPPGEASAIRAHLAECLACRSQFEALEIEEQQILGRLRLLDHPRSQVTAQRIMAAASRRQAGWQRWAAVLVMAVGVAGAAYAIPGSPLRRWVGRLLDSGAAATPPRPTGSGAQVPQAPIGSSSMGGVAVDPGSRLIIAFQSADSGSRVLVTLVTTTDVVVQAPNGSANYTADVGRILVDNHPGPVDFIVEIPTTAPRVEIRVGSRRIFLKEGPTQSTDPKFDGSWPLVLRLDLPRDSAGSR